MRIIGLGGVASGKSLVARQLAALGAGVLDADRAGHEVLRLPHVEAAARQRWGEAVFGPDGRIDRGRLAAIVFRPRPEGRARTEVPGTVDPSGNRPPAARAGRRLGGGGQRGGRALDAPLLLEAGWDKLCDKMVFVDAPWEARLARAWPAVGPRRICGP